MLLSDVACDHVLKMHIQQHDAETRTLGHNNAEVVLRFCLPKLTAVVNSSCAGPFLCFCRMLHVTISWKCAFSSMMQKQGHALVKARGFLGSVCVCLTSLLWCFDMCYWRPLFFGTAGNQLGQQILAGSTLKYVPKQSIP